jgi:hypothetical protein
MTKEQKKKANLWLMDMKAHRQRKMWRQVKRNTLLLLCMASTAFVTWLIITKGGL